MPQFMQRAAWSRVSFSESGTTNSLKCWMRAATDVYLRSCRSISRKPVTLPINPRRPCDNRLYILPRHCEERGDEAIQAVGLRKNSGLLRFARNDVRYSRPDRDLRLGVGVGGQLAKRAA